MTLIGLGASGTFPAYLLLSEGLENKGIYGDCGPDGEACIARQAARVCLPIIGDLRGHRLCMGLWVSRS